MTENSFNGLADAMRSLGEAAERAAKGFSVLLNVITEHREELLCTGPGQWPDKYTLLNRYVRTDLEPPFIIND